MSISMLRFHFLFIIYIKSSYNKLVITKNSSLSYEDSTSRKERKEKSCRCFLLIVQQNLEIAGQNVSGMLRKEKIIFPIRV
jgi:hypothetical protein